MLIDCAASLAPEARAAYEDAYGPDGTCWSSGPGAWAGCRDFCAMTLEALNLVAMVSGDSCGTCTTVADCKEYGSLATCEAGFCAGGNGSSTTGQSGESGSATGDGSGTDTSNGSDTDGCESVPVVCQDMLACFAVVLPDSDTADYEAGGACWCGGSDLANSCYSTCVDQLAAAAAAYPNVEACAGPIDPCPDGTEGCECFWPAETCKDNLVCDWDNDCQLPEFGECYWWDQFCPAQGCEFGTVYNDQDDDGTPDFAVCRLPCQEARGPYECNDIMYNLDTPGDPHCVNASYFNVSTGLTCVNDCSSGCANGSVCVNGLCWYDVP